MENNQKFIRFHYQQISPIWDYYWFEIKENPSPDEKGWHPIPKSGCIAYYSYPMDPGDDWFIVDANGKEHRIKISDEELNKALEVLKAEAIELGIPANFEVLTPEIITKVSILEPSNPTHRWWHRQVWYMKWFKEHLDHIKEIYEEKIGDKKAHKLCKQAMQMAKKYNAHDREGLQFWTTHYLKEILQRKSIDLAEYIVLRLCKDI